ncbi:MAG TPA: VOC family protein [Candidatus Acidoferrales bacterium]|nr:VOC family protein [Candidatus Acidoferrales bacterium]
MKLSKLTPLLRVADLDATIAFYHDVLGFTCLNRMDGWALMANGGVELMIALPNAHEPFDGAALTGSLYFLDDDVDATYESIKDRVDIVYPIETFDYGMREFAIRDNNGYCLQFGREALT